MPEWIPVREVGMGSLFQYMSPVMLVCTSRQWDENRVYHLDGDGRVWSLHAHPNDVLRVLVRVVVAKAC